MHLNGKHIIVATDLSARSDRAVDRAFLLAQQWAVPLFVLHALEPGSRLEVNPDLAESAIRAVLPNPDANVEIIPAIGSAPTVIVAAGRSSDCGLIVTGVARFNHVGDYLVGTAVDHVVRHASVPVLVVKQRPRKAYTSIIVATDFSKCARNAVLTAARMFPDLAIHVVHAYHVPYEGRLNSEDVKRDVAQEVQEELDAFIAAPEIPDEIRARLLPRLAYGELQNAILTIAHEIDADLLVLGTNGRSGLAHAVLGSKAEDLLQSAGIDTMMVRRAK